MFPECALEGIYAEQLWGRVGGAVRVISLKEEK